MTKTKKNIAILSLIISVFALFGAAAFMLNAKRAFAETSYTLSFQGDVDITSSMDGWWSESGGVNGVTFDLENSEMTVDFSTAGGVVYCNAFGTAEGKEYTVSFDSKAISGTGSFHYFRGDGWALVKDWIPAGTSDYVTNSYTFTAGSNGDMLIFQDPNKDSVISFRNIKITGPLQKKSNIASSMEGWWSQSGGANGITAEDGIVTIDFSAAGGTVYRDQTTVQGKEYLISVEYKAADAGTSGAVHFFTSYSAWSAIKTDNILSDEWQTYTGKFTATSNADRFTVQSGVKVQLRNIIITDKCVEKIVTENAAIGALPEIPAKEGYRGYWAVDGTEITTDTVYNFGANKTATIVYEEDVVKYTLSFQSKTDLASSMEGWWSQSGSTNGMTFNLENAEITVDFPTAGAVVYCDYFKTTEGKTYTVSFDCKTVSGTGKFHYFRGTSWALVKDWIPAGTDDYTTYSYTFTAGSDGDMLIFQDAPSTSDSVISFRNIIITDTVEERTIAENTAIGALPEISAKEGYRGYWTVDGTEITADTVYNFGADKVAAIVYEKTTFTLSFDNLTNAYDMAGSTESWNRYNVPVANGEGGVTLTYASTDGTKNYAAGVDKYTVEAGKTYVVKMNVRTSANVFINLAVEVPEWKALLGTWAEAVSWISDDYTEWSIEYTAGASGAANLIFQLTAGAGGIYVKDFTLTEKLTDKSVTQNAAIGELPSIPARAGYRGYWTIDGAEITANTAYSFGSDKTAVLVYEKEKSAIKSVSISTNGDIALNFYANVVDENVKAFFTVDGRTIEATSYTLSNGSQRVYSYPLAAKDYAKVVTLTLGEGEDAVSANASVKAYIDAGKDKFDDSLKALVEALEVYCDSAAKYFAGETVDTIQPDGDELANYAPTKEGTLPTGVTVSGITLTLESTTTIRLYVAGENLDGVTYTIDGTEVALLTLADGTRYIEMANIAAKDLDRTYAFQIGGCVVNVSALGYAHLVVNKGASDDENLKNLLIATYNYSIAANAYFGADTISVSTAMGKSIVYANKSENGVQGKYVDNEKTAYTVSNDRVSLTHNLTNRGNLFVSSLASANGAYLTNTMDVYMNSNVNGTETETYACNSTDIQRDGFSTTACAPYVNVNKLGYYYYQVNVRNLNFGNNLFLDKTYHVYSDKLYQEYRIVNYGDTAASLNFIAFQAVMPVSAVTKFEISDGANVVSSLEGEYKIVENPQYAAFDIAGVGVVGFINSTAENCDFVIIRSGDNYYFRQRFYVTTVEAKGAAGFGSRVYTDSAHAFDGIRAANAEENNPLTAAEITVSGDGASFVGYDRLRGYYVCKIDGSWFAPAGEYPNRKFIEKITVNAPDERKVFFYINSDYPLEGAAITDENDMLMPIGTQVSKNFAHEHEEPVYDPDDKMYGDTIFPIVTTKNKPLTFSVVNVYENWGNYLAKQISSISYYVAYYHLSSGVRETNCIAPYYATYLNKDEMGSWILPDFRGASCDGQYNPADGSTDSQQRNTVGAMNGVSNGTALTAEGADLGVYQGSEIISAGLTYADLKYSYISKTGDYKYSYRHVEMPQTDESRTYYTIEMEFLKATTFNQSSFSFFSFDTRVAGFTYANAAYLDESGNPQEVTIDSKKLASTSSIINKWSDKAYKLHKGGSYFAFYNGTAGNEEFGNFGLIVQSSSWTHDGVTEELDLAFYNSRIQRGGKYVNRGSLTVGEDWAFPAGATVTLNVILLPFGARQWQENYDNVKKVYQDSVVNKIQAEASRGIVLEDAFVPTVRALGDVAQFTLSGGATELNENGVIYAVKVTGFNKLGKLKVEKLNDAGEWETVELASESGFDGYGVKYENGTAEYSFVTTKTTADATYRVSVI